MAHSTSAARALAVTLTAFVAVLSALPPVAAHAAMPAMYANCANLQKTFPHGVGRVGATDRVAAGSRPVTTWKRDTKAYDRAMGYNRGLDRDKDNVACEKR